MKRINLYLPDQLILALKRIQHEKGLTMSEIIRRALDEYIKGR